MWKFFKRVQSPKSKAHCRDLKALIQRLKIWDNHPCNGLILEAPSEQTMGCNPCFDKDQHKGDQWEWRARVVKSWITTHSTLGAEPRSLLIPWLTKVPQQIIWAVLIQFSSLKDVGKSRFFKALGSGERQPTPELFSGGEKHLVLAQISSCRSTSHPYKTSCIGVWESFTQFVTGNIKYE